MRRCANTFGTIQHVEVSLEKFAFHPVNIFNIILTFNQLWYEMKSYDELKAEMEAIQQQMVECSNRTR